MSASPDNAQSVEFDDLIPRVSVIVPTRDRPDLLAEALQSIQSQSHKAWQAIIIDDGGELPLRLPDDPRFQVIRHSTSRGPAAARNTGLRAARGAYVIFLDDDDKLVEDALENLLAAAKPGRIVIGLKRQIGSSPSSAPALRWNGRMGSGIINNPPAHVQGMFPRETCELYDDTFRTGEDFEWLFRMAQKHEFLTIERVTYLHRTHDTPRLGVDPRTHLIGRLRFLEKHQDWFEQNRSSHAIQLRRASSAALIAKEYSLARKLAMTSWIKRPNLLAAKVFGKSIVRSGARLGQRAKLSSFSIGSRSQ